MHPSSRIMLSDTLALNKWLSKRRGGKARVLDVGSYDPDGVHKKLVRRHGWDYEGIDMREGPNVTHVTDDPYDWPIEDESYDIVISGQCMEHVPMPWLWILELARVVVQEGFVIVIAPNTWHYHEHPVDCWRVWPEGMKALMEHAGLEVLATKYSGPDTMGLSKRPKK